MVNTTKCFFCLRNDSLCVEWGVKAGSLSLGLGVLFLLKTVLQSFRVPVTNDTTRKCFVRRQKPSGSRYGNLDMASPSASMLQTLSRHPFRLQHFVSQFTDRLPGNRRRHSNGSLRDLDNDTSNCRVVVSSQDFPLTL